MESARNNYEKILASHPPCTNFHAAKGGFKAVLDHILYSKDNVQVKSLLEMPSESELTAETALPSSVFPSDHLRIQAKLVLDFSKARTELPKEELSSESQTEDLIEPPVQMITEPPEVLPVNYEDP